MNKKLVAILQYFVFAALAAFFVWLSFPVLLLLLLSHWLRALRWRQLMEPMGYHPSKLNTLFGVMIGYFVNLGAPRLGEVLKCTIIARYDKVPADKLVGTIVAERAFDVICLLTVFALTFFFQYDVIHAMTSGKFGGLFHNAQGQTSYIKIGLLVFAVALIFFICR